MRFENKERRLGNILSPTQADRARSFELAEALVDRVVAENHDRPSLVTSIATRIGAEIIEGRRKPGDDLNTVDLAVQYQTSRTPVREALMLLEKERLVEIPPRRRPRVASLTLSEIRDIYIARAALLEIVAANVAEHASHDQLAALRRIAERMAEAERTGNLVDLLWANVDFHELNTHIGGNMTIRKVVATLVLRTLPVKRFSLAQTGGIKRSTEDHLHLMSAYEKRDARLSAAIIRANHYNSLRRIEANAGELQSA